MSVERLFSDLFPIIPKVVSQACANLGYHPDQMGSDDLVQGIILLLIADEYRVLRSFDRRSQPQTWLYTIARRYILRRLLEQGRIVSLDDLLPDTFKISLDPDEQLLSKEKGKILHAAAGKLTEREQKLFGLLRQGLSVEEIAVEMKVKRRSASVMKRNLIKKLQRIIRGE
jgi:RNA polymerase sigma factor (sigma-70 family)